VYAYFTYAATARKITDDVTKLVMHRVFNTNLLVHLLRTFFDKNVLLDEFK